MEGAFCNRVIYYRKCPICGDQAIIHKVDDVDYDLLCNIPKRELLPDEIIDYTKIGKESIKEFAIIDTRGKQKFEQIKSIAMHIQLFEIKNFIEEIKKLASEKTSI